MTEPRTPTGQLWLAPLSGRFFLVPEAMVASAPAGSHWVADLDAGAQRVDLSAWAPYEVDEATALALYRGRLASGAAAVVAGVEAPMRALNAALPGLGALVARLNTDEGGPLDGPEALALLSGRSRAQVEAAPAAARDAILDAVQSLAAAPALARPETPAGEAVRVPAQATAAEREAFGDLVARLTLGVEVPVDAPSGAAGVAAPPPDARALLAAVRRAVDALGPLEAPESDEARLARYRADARANIDRATAGWKPPTPTVEELLRMGDDQ
jgi:hypothetical protein